MNPTERLEALTAACHAAWYAYTVLGLGQPGEPWATTPEAQKSSMRHGVAFWDALPTGLSLDELAQASHLAWCNFKKREGWVLGPVKDFEKKTHPDLVDWAELPEAERKKNLVVLNAYFTMKDLLPLVG